MFSRGTFERGATPKAGRAGGGGATRGQDVSYLEGLASQSAQGGRVLKALELVHHFLFSQRLTFDHTSTTDQRSSNNEMKMMSTMQTEEMLYLSTYGIGFASGVALQCSGVGTSHVP